MPTALITGVTGQDGSYLAEFLLQKYYTVVGMVRRSSTVTYERIVLQVTRIDGRGVGEAVVLYAPAEGEDERE